MGDKSKKGERNCQIFEDHASGLQIQNFCVLREGKARVRQTGAHRKWVRQPFSNLFAGSGNATTRSVTVIQPRDVNHLKCSFLILR